MWKWKHVGEKTLAIEHGIVNNSRNKHGEVSHWEDGKPQEAIVRWNVKGWPRYWWICEGTPNQHVVKRKRVSGAPRRILGKTKLSISLFEALRSFWTDLGLQEVNAGESHWVQADWDSALASHLIRKWSGSVHWDQMKRKTKDMKKTGSLQEKRFWLCFWRHVGCQHMPTGSHVAALSWAITGCKRNEDRDELCQGW